nr:MAG TPA: hypothetical protein [Caudoviricetes sp.]
MPGGHAAGPPFLHSNIHREIAGYCLTNRLSRANIALP